jgi:hypothetical protein
LDQAALNDPVKAFQLGHLPDFKASPRLIQGFGQRHRLSLRRPSLKKRPRVKGEQLAAFVSQIQELPNRHPRNRVINLDETNWRTVPAGFLTWAETGTESATCHLEDDEASGVTVIWRVTELGCTDRLQPLDRRVFGVLKAYARDIWRKRYYETKGAKTARRDSAANLLEAWDRISEEVMQGAWELYIWGIGDEPEDDGDDEFQLRVSLQDLRDLYTFPARKSSLGWDEGV